MTREPKTRYTLTEPCANCPFRTDKPFYLGHDRAEEIADSIRGGGNFWCHRTVNYDEPEYDEDGEEVECNPVASKTRACAGYLIVMEKEEAPNQIMRIAERFGMYDASKLNMDAPVFDSLDDWVDSQDYA